MPSNGSKRRSRSRSKSPSRKRQRYERSSNSSSSSSSGSSSSGRSSSSRDGRGRDKRDDRGRSDRSDRSDRDRDSRDRRKSHRNEGSKDTKKEEKREREREADMAYRKRVEEQLRQMEEEKKKKTEAAKAPETKEQRKARRAARLAQLKAKMAAKAHGSSTDSNENNQTSTANNNNSNDTNSNDRADLEKRQKEEQEERERKRESERKKREEEEQRKAEEEFDLFSDPVEKLTVAEQKKKERAGALGLGLEDEHDDAEGYYVFRLGDILNDRYQVYANQGRGVFSSVLRVRDLLDNNRELVVKVIRQKETMREAGIRELEFLRDLRETDPENKKHCCRLLSHFEHMNHLCMVFEPMAMNLRQLIKRLGGGGISLEAVRSYAKQLFIALRHMRKCNIVHGDIKPDNILVNEDPHNIVKICDFGSAGRIDACEITPYLVSRYYRAPEVMLGLRYNEQIDMWAIGCCLYELYTGKIMYQGKDNNKMLQLFQEYHGPFSNKLLKRGEFTNQHFDEKLMFYRKRLDPLTKEELVRSVQYQKPTRQIYHDLKKAAPRHLNDYEKKKLSQLNDLLKQMMVLNPDNRCNVDAALKHPFIQDNDM